MSQVTPPKEKPAEPREWWIDLGQDADVMIETEDEGEISIDSWCAFDYAVNEDAIHVIEYSAYQAKCEELDRLRKREALGLQQLQAAQGELANIQQAFEIKEPHLYRLKQELRHLRECEQLLGRVAADLSAERAKAVELEMALKVSREASQGMFKCIKELKSQNAELEQDRENRTCGYCDFDRSLSKERDQLILHSRRLEKALEKISKADCPSSVAHPQSVWWIIHVQSMAKKALKGEVDGGV